MTFSPQLSPGKKKKMQVKPVDSLLSSLDYDQKMGVDD